MLIPHPNTGSEQDDVVEKVLSQEDKSEELQVSTTNLLKLITMYQALWIKS